MVGGTARSPSSRDVTSDKSGEHADATAEVHDYHDTATGVLAASLAKRAPGYTSLGFPDPRRLV
jgi:hypothetical protein